MPVKLHCSRDILEAVLSFVSRFIEISVNSGFFLVWAGTFVSGMGVRIGARMNKFAITIEFHVLFQFPGKQQKNTF